MMDAAELPESWAAVTLEAVADVHDNLREPVNSTERKGRVGPFPYYGATGQVGWIDDFRQEGEYVLLGEDGAPFFDPTKDKAYLVSGKCWVNNHAHVLKGREGVCLNRYLLYALNQVNYRGFANGTTRLKLTQAAMRQLPINLAPLAEQHCIVAKIEELFSELDQGVASLKTAREQLKVYRQSLLKNAFEGKLTAAWRGAHRDQLETATALQQRIAREREARYQQQLADWQTANKPGPKPKAPKPLPPLTPEELAELPELPAGWGWFKFGSVSENFDGKRVPLSAKEREGRKGLYPYFGACSVIDHVDDYLFDGDYILIGEDGANLLSKSKPLAFLVSGKFWVNNHAHIVQPLGFCQAKYLVYQFGAINLVRFITGTAQPKLTQANLDKVPIALCSFDEQEEIVQELESKLSEADQLDQTLATALQQADALRQSILKKAFCGQLVPQDPNDEPATALLERIRAARSTNPPARRGRSARSQA